MTKFKYLLGIASVIAFTSCDKNNTTTIAGTAETGVSEVYISRLSPQKQEFLDTLTLAGGNFSYEMMADSAEFYVVSTNDNYNIPLYLEPGEDVKIQITGSNESRIYTVEGSEGSTRILKINNIIRDARARVDSLNQINDTYADSSDFAAVREELNTSFEKIVEETRNKMKALIDEDPGNITNLFVFPASIGNFQLISPSEEIEYYEKVAEGLEKNYPDNEHVAFFKDRLEKMKEAVALNKELEETRKNMKTGNPVPEIEMAGPNGEIRKLSDLKGKVVLVDFWAAWCRPCRFENPNLVRIYNQYKDQGFDVFSVSLDGVPQQPDPKEAWIQAIQQDGLVWENHVSEIQGWNSSVVRKFGFNGIPYTVLVDRDGTIIATELRGPELENKLKEVLGKS